LISNELFSQLERKALMRHQYVTGHSPTQTAGRLSGFPIVIAEWPRNKREVIRLSLDEYQGCKTIDCRVWWHDGDGVLKPGKYGLTLAVKHLPALANAVAKALDAARALGLLSDGGEQ
jgi:hypothetical protein